MSFANGTTIPKVFPHHPNLRDFSHASEYTASITSLVMNTVLCTLLAKEKNDVMKPYNRVLFQNMACDYIYTFVCLVTNMVVISESNMFEPDLRPIGTQFN